MFFKSTMPSQNKPNRSSSVQLKQVSCKPLLPLVNGNMQPILTSLQTLHNFRHPQKGLGSMKRLPPPPIVKLLDIKGKLSERTIAKRPTLNFLIGKFPMAWTGSYRHCSVHRMVARNFLKRKCKSTFNPISRFPNVDLICCNMFIMFLTIFMFSSIFTEWFISLISIIFLSQLH